MIEDDATRDLDIVRSSTALQKLDAALARRGLDLVQKVEDQRARIPVLRQRFEGHTEEVTGVGFSPDGKHAYSASEDGTVRAWDLASGTQSASFRHHAAEPEPEDFSYGALAVGPDKLLAGGTYGYDRSSEITLLEPQTLREVGRLEYYNHVNRQGH